MEETMIGESRPEKVTPEEADRLAIEELKKETKEGFLRKFFWPPALWRGIRKPSAPPASSTPGNAAEAKEDYEPPKKWEDLL